MSGKLFIISAPSGAGKTSIVERLLTSISYCCNIGRVITYTSKSPRFNEKDGEHYFFITDDEFKKKIDKDFFMEWSDAYGCFYGSPCSILNEIECGRSYILIIDRVGAEKIAARCKNAVLIWIYTKSLDILKQRLEKRDTETPKQIEHRLSCARFEIKQELQHPLYKYHILNDDFDRAVCKLERIIKRELFGEGFWLKGPIQ